PPRPNAGPQEAGPPWCAGFVTGRRGGTPTMEGNLPDDVAKVGRRGEVRDVSDGYARNYLIPKKLALGATAGNLKNLGQIQKQQDAKASRIKSEAEALRDRIEALAYEERRQASEEGKLFGSVTAQEIVEFLDQHTIKVERRRVGLDEPI